MKPKVISIPEEVWTELKGAEIRVNAWLRAFRVKYQRCFNLAFGPHADRYMESEDYGPLPDSISAIERQFEAYRHSVYVHYQPFKKAAKRMRSLCAKRIAGDTAITTTKLCRAFAAMVEAGETGLQKIHESAVECQRRMTEADIHIAAFLMARGFRLIDLVQCGPNRYGFRFADPNHQAADAMRAYYAGAQAEAKALLESFRSLKDRLYAEKSQSKGNSNGLSAYGNTRQRVAVYAAQIP